MKKLFIVGSGGFGREVLWLAKRINEECIRVGKNQSGILSVLSMIMNHSMELRRMAILSLAGVATL